MRKYVKAAILIFILGAPFAWFYSVYNDYYDGVDQRERNSNEAKDGAAAKPSQK